MNQMQPVVAAVQKKTARMYRIQALSHFRTHHLQIVQKQLTAAETVAQIH